MTTCFHETEDSIANIQDAFALLSEKETGEKCEAVEGLILETEKRIIDTTEGSLLRDIALVCCLQKIEQHKLTSYTILCTMAVVLAKPGIEEIFLATLQDVQGLHDTLKDVYSNLMMEEGLGNNEFPSGD
jgi:ferritin-like metal-binding protein YciE